MKTLQQRVSGEVGTAIMEKHFGCQGGGWVGSISRIGRRVETPELCHDPLQKMNIGHIHDGQE